MSRCVSCWKNRCLVLPAFLVSLVAMLSGCAGSSSTGQLFPQHDQLSPPSLFFHFVNYVDTTRSGAFMVYARVAYSNLVFIKDNAGKFTASYTLSVDFFRDEDNQQYVTGKAIDRAVTVYSFPETNSAAMFDTAQADIAIQPGIYYSVVRFVDHNSGQQSIRKLKTIVKDFTKGGIVLSSLFLMPTPLKIPERFQTIDQISDLSRSTVAATQMKANKAGSVRFEFLVTGRNRRQALDSTVMAQVDSGQLSWVTMDIPGDILTTGEFTVLVRGTINAANDVTGGHFIVLQELRPTGKLQLEEAIDELAIVAPSDQISNMKIGTFAERQTKFKKYWVTMAGSDEQLADALMREFYSRVAAANSKFAFSRIAGWQTDRGKVYVKYGPPDDVERS